jgi:2-polyprenyl-3-methyl-5-hydroxy-6-metoxy-1,4-benzoquinol methylase
MQFSIVLPTRLRGAQVRELVQSAADTADAFDRIQFCFYLDHGDEESRLTLLELQRSALVAPRGAEQIRFMQAGPDEKLNLSEMWNAAYRELATGSILMHCGDDIRFRTRGWDTTIARCFDESADKILLVYGDDGIQHENLATHSFVHRRWIEASGFWLPPYFVSDYNDTWLDHVARLIGRRVYLPNVYTEHLHYSIGKAPVDVNTLDRLARHAQLAPGNLYESKSAEREQHAQRLRDYISACEKKQQKDLPPKKLFDSAAQRQSWQRVPLDGVGYVDTQQLLTEKSDQELRAMVDKFRTERYRLDGWRNYRNRWRELLRLDSMTGKRVLDYGCGLGIESLELARAGNTVSVADLSPSHLDLAERIFGLYGKQPAEKLLLSLEAPFFPAAAAAAAASAPPPPPPRYDVFFSSGVLHHTPYFSEILREVAAHKLAEDGDILLMLYSDRGWKALASADVPAAAEDVTKHPAFGRFVAAMDDVGAYADFYTPEKLLLKVGDFLELRDYQYITEDDRFCVAHLRRRRRPLDDPVKK